MHSNLFLGATFSILSGAGKTGTAVYISWAGESGAIICSIWVLPG